jgi:hypothetical protein
MRNGISRFKQLRDSAKLELQSETYHLPDDGDYTPDRAGTLVGV